VAIIKETDSIKPRLDTLQQIADQAKSTNPAVYKQVINEIRNRKAGHAAETHAAFMLGKEYRDHPYSVLVNDLRLDMDGDLAQIDHVAVSAFGIVNLFETKSFSTGLKVDQDGTCWTWKGRQSLEIPSPLRQSQRHESSLRKALESCGYEVIEFRHFVLVDYKARLDKPRKGFENFCRPDRISEARQQVSLGVASTFRALGRLATGKSLSKDVLCELGHQLAAMHKPLPFDPWKKFGISVPATQAPPEKNLLTSSRLAKNLGLQTQEFLLQAAKAGLAYEMDGKFYASLDGEQLGAKNCKGRYGPYILWPQDLSL